MENNVLFEHTYSILFPILAVKILNCNTLNQKKRNVDAKKRRRGPYGPRRCVPDGLHNCPHKCKTKFANYMKTSKHV